MDELRPELIDSGENEEKPARPRRLFFAGFLLAGLVAACGPAQKDASQPGSESLPAADTADTIPSAEASLASFRRELPAVTRLEGGAPSRDRLVEDFIAAVERNDTASVSRMHVTRAEYAYLYFPTSIYMRKPYVQPPAIAWLLSTQSSEKGISRVLRRLGGQSLTYAGYDCGEESREGDNTFWRSCTVTYTDPHDRSVVTRRLFGAVIERHGRYKFLSYANDF